MSSKASMIHCQKASVTKCTSTQGNPKGKEPLRIILARYELLSFPSWPTLLFLPPWLKMLPNPSCFAWLDGMSQPCRALWRLNRYCCLTGKTWTVPDKCGSNNSNRKRHREINTASTDVFHFTSSQNVMGTNLKFPNKKKGLKREISYNFHQQCEASLPLLCHNKSPLQSKRAANFCVISNLYPSRQRGKRNFSVWTHKAITVKSPFMCSPSSAL